MNFPFLTKKPESSSQLSPSLEDYLETIYDLSQKKDASVRVKDIAKARSVKAASVSVALGKLAELGHVDYTQRGRISLTQTGLQIGRKMLSRHNLLCRFFTEVLELPKDEAEEQACAIEHSLTDRGMNQLVRFFEFLCSCPDVGNVLERFHTCPRRHEEILDDGNEASEAAIDHCAACHPEKSDDQRVVPLSSLSAGTTAKVTNVISHGAIRQRMLDMGLLPRAQVSVERVGLGGEMVWIKCLGAQVALRKSEASSVLVIADKK